MWTYLVIGSVLVAVGSGQWTSWDNQTNNLGVGRPGGGFYQNLQPGVAGQVPGILSTPTGQLRERQFTINDEEYYLKYFYLTNRKFKDNPSYKLIAGGGAVGMGKDGSDGSGGGLNYKRIVKFNRNFYDYQNQRIRGVNSPKDINLLRETHRLEEERKRDDVYLQQEFKYYCPEYWLTDPIQQLCYRVIKSPRKDWLQAKRVCETLNGNLLNVDSIEKHSFILKYLILDNQIQNQYWISATMQGPAPAFLRDEELLNQNRQLIQGRINPVDNDLNTSKKKNPLFEKNENERINQGLHNIIYVNEDRSRFIDAFDKNQISFDPIDLAQNDEFLDGYEEGLRLGKVEGQTFVGPGGVITGHTGLRNIEAGIGRKFYDKNQLFRTKLVYGYSVKNQRWMFLPKFDYQKNFFICESNKNFNLNKNFQLFLNKQQRHLDYGFDLEKMPKNLMNKIEIPMGPRFVRQPQNVNYDFVQKNMIIKSDAQLKNLDSVLMATSNELELKCLAVGFPVPTYKWYKEFYRDDKITFEEIDPMKESRYIISGGNFIIRDPNKTVDTGKYFCMAENKYGRIISEKIYINFGYIMEFNLKRSAENGELNWGKSVYCDPPQNYPGVKYYWSRNFFPNFVDEDQRVFVSHDGSLYFSNIEIVDRANYSCTVQSLISNMGRNGPFFPLRVKATPNYQSLIMANKFPKIFPENAVAGYDVRLECMAYGYPVPHYNWTRLNQNLPKNSQISNFGRVLTIKNATINNNGIYSCTAFNDRKSAMNYIELNLQMEPKFTIPLYDQVGDFQGEVMFECEAIGVPDVNYTWYKNGNMMEKNEINDKIKLDDNILVIKFLDPNKDNGMYQCCAQNALKMVCSAAQLRVLGIKPSFKKKPLEPEIYSIYNGNTTIFCEPEAAPRAKIQWKKDGNLIDTGGHRRVLHQTGALVITPTTRHDEGIYMCVASNIYGTEQSETRLIVLDEIRFITALPPFTQAQIGEFLYLHCDVTHDALLDVAYVWTHNGRRLENPESRIEEEFNEEIEDIIKSERFFINNNELEIHNLTVLDSGTYACKVKSSINELISTTQVQVLGPPGPCGGLKIVEIKKRVAILEWIDGAANGRPILSYYVYGRTNWNRTFVKLGGVGAQTSNSRYDVYEPTEMVVFAQEIDRYTGRKRAEVKGLTPWSNYDFQVAAVNDLGEGPRSTSSPVYGTDSDKVFVAPKGLTGGGGKIGDLNIKWNLLMPEDQNAPKIWYKVFWRLTDPTRPNGEWATKEVHNFKFSGLESLKLKKGSTTVPIPLNNYYTKYDVKVQAWNSVGPGPESEIVTIYSAEDMPQVAPQTPVAKGFNSTALNVSWVPVEHTREKIRGNLIGHRLKYWKKDHKEEDAVYYLSRTQRPWALIVGLEPDTYYFVKVMVYNAAGEGPESERYLERTYRKAPQKPPSSVFFNAIDPSTVRVVWRYVAPSQEEEPVEGFKVRLWDSDQDMSTANDTIIPLGSKLECYIRNLQPGKAYKMRVLAFSNGGDGRMSSPTLNFQMGRTRIRNSAPRMTSNNTFLWPILLLVSILITVGYE